MRALRLCDHAFGVAIPTLTQQRLFSGQRDAVSTGFVQWVVLLGVLQGVLPGSGEGQPLHPLSIARPASTSFPRESGIHPIKKRVGRAVNPTMDRIDNVWFVLSQIVVPLAAILFSVLYVRRHWARQTGQSAPSAEPPPRCPAEKPEE